MILEHHTELPSLILHGIPPLLQLSPDSTYWTPVQEPQSDGRLSESCKEREPYVKNPLCHSLYRACRRMTSTFFQMAASHIQIFQNLACQPLEFGGQAGPKTSSHMLKN
eukprot:7853996-Karenia_brevis.AAC.1